MTDQERLDAIWLLQFIVRRRLDETDFALWEIECDA